MRQSKNGMADHVIYSCAFCGNNYLAKSRKKCTQCGRGLMQHVLDKEWRKREKEWPSSKGGIIIQNKRTNYVDYTRFYKGAGTVLQGIDDEY